MLPTPAPSSARPADHPAPLLTLLHDAGVDFVLVGALAAQARGAVLPPRDEPRTNQVIEITPRPTRPNLDQLSEAVRRAGHPRLRVTTGGAAPELRLDAALFDHLNVLPLTTDMAGLTVLLPRNDYTDLLHQVSAVVVDGVSVLVPTVDWLLANPADAAYEPDAGIAAELERLRLAQTLESAATPPATIADLAAEEALRRVILEILDQHERPVSVRELMFAANSWRPVTYRQVKITAETLTAAGHLVRVRSGTANRYRRNSDPDDRTAHEVAALLIRTRDPVAVTGRALRLLRQAHP